jgi:hypothetical protein
MLACSVVKPLGLRPEMHAGCAWHASHRRDSHDMQCRYSTLARRFSAGISDVSSHAAVYASRRPSDKATEHAAACTLTSMQSMHRMPLLEGSAVSQPAGRTCCMAFSASTVMKLFILGSREAIAARCCEVISWMERLPARTSSTSCRIKGCAARILQEQRTERCSRRLLRRIVSARVARRQLLLRSHFIPIATHGHKCALAAI